MTARLCTEDAVAAWLRALTPAHEVLFPRRSDEDGAVRFEIVGDDSPIRFDGYLPTQLPPAKIFAPARDPLFAFRATSDGAFEVEAHFDTTPRVIAGVRPCDLKAIHLMDGVNAEGQADPH